MGEVRVDLHAPLVEQIGEHGGGGFGGLVDQIVGAEPRVGAVVVDHQDALRSGQAARELPESADRAAVHGDEEIHLVTDLPGGHP